MSPATTTSKTKRRKSSEAAEGPSESIGQRLARLRRERGVTQQELASEMGITQSVVSEYERDNFRLHSEHLIQLSRLLGVSADELLGLQKPRTSAAVQARKRFLSRLQRIDRLPKRDQQALLRTIDAFLGKAS